MVSPTNRRSETEYGGAPHGSDYASLVLLRVPNLAPQEPATEVPPAAEPVSQASAATGSALYRDHSTSEPLEAATESPHEEAPAASEPEKTWRADTRHTPFRPEKYNSNIATKLVAGSLALGAVVLVYFALFGTGGNDPAASTDAWDVAELEEGSQTNPAAPQIDLGSESHIGESSSLPSPRVAQNPPSATSQQPMPSQPTTQVAPDTPVAEAAEPSLSAPAAATATGSDSLSGVLPWRQEQAAAAAPGFESPAGVEAATPYPSSEAELPLNAPVTQTAPTQPTYAEEQPAYDTAYPTTDYPATGYPATNYPETLAAPAYPQTGAGEELYRSTDDDGASSYDAPSHSGDADSQGAGNYPATPYHAGPIPSQAQPWNASGTQSTATNPYPTTSTPGGQYPQTNYPDTPREWRR